MIMKQSVNHFLSIVKTICFPSKCISCQKIFTTPNTAESNMPQFGDVPPDLDEKALFSAVMQPFLCKNCLIKHTPITSPICNSCGMMFKERVSDDHLCGECIKTPPKLRIARSAGIYDQSLLRLIRAYKFGRKLQLADPLGILLSALYRKTYWDADANNWSSDSPDLIIPVPLHKKRFRQRKFNQAWLLFRDWQHPKPSNGILIRQKRTKPQTGLDKNRRKSNIKGAFCITPSQEIGGKKVLIIDDVYTTGATAAECAKVLLKNGAKHVDVLTLARTEAVKNG